MMKHRKIANLMSWKYSTYPAPRNLTFCRSEHKESGVLAGSRLQHGHSLEIRDFLSSALREEMSDVSPTLLALCCKSILLHVFRQAPNLEESGHPRIPSVPLVSA